LTDTTGERLAVGQLDEESEPAELKDLQTYVSAAMERRPEIQQLEEAIKARELQVSLEKSNFLPNLFVAANFGVAWSTEETAKQPVCERASENAECINVPNRFARPDNDPLNRLSIGIGAGIRWNLDPLNQVGKLNERRAQLRQIKAQYRRAVGAIRLDIKKKWKDASEALKKIGINDRRLEAARRWRDQLGFSIETAGAEISDAIDPLKAFYEAKAKYLEARYNYLIARAALAQGVGAAKLGDVEAGNRVDGTGSLEAAGAEPGE
jgi:outer membrane protein TolC